jgi:hypothetical protein
MEPRRLLAFSVGGLGFAYGSASPRLADGSLIVAGLFSGSVELAVGALMRIAGAAESATTTFTAVE